MNNDSEILTGSEYNAQAQRLMFDAQARLFQTFPEQDWRVDVKPFQGIMLVWENNLSPEDTKYVLHLNKLDYPELKRVVTAGGEILERHGVL